MTTMQWIGLAVGALIVLLRFPGIAWPDAYKRFALGVLERTPHVARAIGAVLWVIAISILVLVAGTLTMLQVVMLVVAVLFVIVGVVLVLFPDAYRAFAQRTLNWLPLVGVRIACGVAVALGFWIVYLSLSVR
jgi:uncharacterized protein YjeT (DUF2065 family)